MPVLGHYPIETFIRMSPFRPGDKHVKDYVIKFAEYRRGNCVIMILCPFPNQAVQQLQIVIKIQQKEGV